MTTEQKLRDRFINLLQVQKECQIQQISTVFTERDLKEIIYVLGELIAIKGGTDEG